MLRRIADTLGFSVQEDLVWVPVDRRKEIMNMLHKLQLPERPDRNLEQRLPKASQTCLDFLMKLLEKVPTNRISAVDAIAHPYLQHLHDPAGETTAKKAFAWEFDKFEPSERALKDRIYAECAKMHPEILMRDAVYLKERGFTVKGGG